MPTTTIPSLCTRTSTTLSILSSNMLFLKWILIFCESANSAYCKMHKAMLRAGNGRNFLYIFTTVYLLFLESNTTCWFFKHENLRAFFASGCTCNIILALFHTLVEQNQRDQRGLAPADCWNWGKWGLMEYKWKGFFLAWYLGSFCRHKRFLSYLGYSSQTSAIYIFFPHRTLFHFMCPHRPATLACSRTGSPVS